MMMTDHLPLTPHASPEIPVIAIDGPSASGKGTVAQLVAQALGFHYLDSGALYRLLALAAVRRGVAFDDEEGLAHLAEGLSIRFEGNEMWLDGALVGDAIRTEECGNGASHIAAYPHVRAALLDLQRAFLQAPGLVADGRDMGSVVFPDAQLKIFLTASAEVRADRRHKQLMEKGTHVKIDQILHDIRQRDERDSARSVAPLQKCADASLLDTSSLTIVEAVGEVLERFKQACVR
jgi:cytidylate kinase